MYISLKNASQYVSKQVKIRGWMYNKRGNNNLLFLQIRDGSGCIQAVFEKNMVSEQVFLEAESLTQESSLEITGTIQKHPKKEEYELQGQDIHIIHKNTEEFPISNKEHGIDFLLDNRHLWLRSRRQIAIQKVRNTLIYATYEFFAQEGFTKFDSPILTPNACEGTTDLYEIDHFGTPLFLSQSGQLYLETAIFALGKVFDFGPTFRAEKSKTRRHLNEFWMMDAEAAFITHEENMDIQERLIRFMVLKVLEKNKEDLEILERDTTVLQNITSPFAKLTHKEAVQILHSLGSSIGEKDDLGAEDETILTKQFQTPIFIEKFPAEVKAFYMKRCSQDSSVVLGADLLAPEGYGEIIGGSEREDNYDILLKRIHEENLSEETFSWYLDLRKYGSVPHSGFGFGLERLVTWICGLHHVRESIPYPRTLVRYFP